jgi:hypothetical protein
MNFRQYVSMKDGTRWGVKYRYSARGDQRPANADALPEFPAMVGVRFTTEHRANAAAAALQEAYAAGIEAGSANAGEVTKPVEGLPPPPAYEPPAVEPTPLEQAIENAPAK